MAGKKRINQRASLTDEAYLLIKSEILENRMPPGFQALETDLSQRLKMSRTPVREALIRLQEEGLVEVVPRRGMRVLPLSPADMKDIYEVLTCVESEAAALIAKRRPGERELKPLKKSIADMEKALARDDLDAWADADNRYHRELLSLCSNKRLANIAILYMDQAHRARVFTVKLRKKPVQSTQDHKEQLAAIRDGDFETVRRIYRNHRERASKELMKILGEFKLYNI